MPITIKQYNEDELLEILKDKFVTDNGYREAEFEDQWDMNEATDANSGGILRRAGTVDSDGMDDDGIEVGINYVFKHKRLIHSQLSASPPVATAKATTSEEFDRSSAENSDRCMKHNLRAYNLQEVFDDCSNKTIVFGTGWIKHRWNQNLGDIYSYDKDAGIITMEGDIDCSSPSTWDIWVDSSASHWDKVRHIWERVWFPLEQAVSLWPEQEEFLEGLMNKYKEDERLTGQKFSETSGLIPLLLYYEKGVPENAMLGRMAILDYDCERFIVSPTDSDHIQRPPLDKKQIKKIEKLDARITQIKETNDFGMKLEELQQERQGYLDEVAPPTAILPYSIFTDIDIADTVYGRSFIQYEAGIQDIINRMDNQVLDNVKASGSSTLVVYGEDTEKEAYDDRAINIVRIKGSNATKPSHIAPPPSMPDSVHLRDRLQSGGDDMAGVNDAMFGNVKRETASQALEYSVRQGNLVRRRLFTKYVLLTESVHKHLLHIIRENWGIGRITKIIGKDNTIDSKLIAGMDIAGNQDIVVTYGTNFSMDPQIRRQEILQFLPTIQELAPGALNGRAILELFKLNEIEVPFDILDLGKQMMKEIIENLLRTKKTTELREFQDPEPLLQYAKIYVMTKEYRDLSESDKDLIDEQVGMLQEKMAASAPPPGPEEATPIPGGSPALPPGLPQG